ncbi:hypothetical protein AB1L16_04640 [Peribacillus frigoritolerans]|uniref:hypothetical protein n=1 Tax=Peribacillus frigoritolerans TaxID=450367 RepID=UPI00399F6165
MADLYPIAFVDEDFKKYKLMELKRKYPNEIEIIPIIADVKNRGVFISAQPSEGFIFGVLNKLKFKK